MILKDIIYPNDTIWKESVNIVSKLQSKGFEAYFVGGCVRDVLLGIIPDDYDIASSARPQDVLKIFPEADKIGMRFGVLSIRTEGKGKIQIATFRHDDPKSDGRRPDSVFFSDLAGDGQRRDFTINSIYYDPINEIYSDPNNGIQDLNDKILRIIGNPVQRLKEDHLRILRAVRFAARFGLNFEDNTFEALKKSAQSIDKISPDRIRDELFNCFKHENKVFALELLQKTGILPILLSKFSYDTGLYPRLIDSMSTLHENSENAIWSAFFAPLGKYLKDFPEDVENAMRRLNLSKRIKKAVIAELKKKLSNDEKS